MHKGKFVSQKFEQSSCVFDHCVHFENSIEGFLKRIAAPCQIKFVQFVMKMF